MEQRLAVLDQAMNGPDEREEIPVVRVHGDGQPTVPLFGLRARVGAHHQDGGMTKHNRMDNLEARLEPAHSCVEIRMGHETCEAYKTTFRTRSTQG